ncbi:histone deacetylase 6 isoform X1 [Anoplophora glabripennis]|uniref:histone deacetylase 6 isoform X1 n=2 Tax=Anoplophora glabripennis TaxID=217634 RepID=UPI0008735339|nr:histone deacetylase 6 isoform X1 [Anoplophora glabripennis]
MKNNGDPSTSGSIESTSQKPPLKSLRQLIAEGRNKTLRYSSKKSLEVEVMDHYEAVNNYKQFQDKKTGYVEQESTGHYCIWDRKYPENPERVVCARRRLEALNLIERCERITPETFPEDIFLRKHSKELFERLRQCSEKSDAELQDESSKWDAVFITRETFEDTKKSTQAALTLTLKVARNEYKNGFALIRPPGHHAMANAFCGYCFMNNVAISAEVAIAEGLAKRVLIVDYDVHHGQGVQQLFYDRDDVLYFSIHRYEHGEFWPNLRESDSDYIGTGRGKGYNVNVPLNKTGLGDSDYLAIVFNILLPLAYEYNPDLILISAGYDAAIGCPEGEMLVTPHFYGHLITLLSGLANGKLVVLLEGGYFKESLAEGVACTLKALLGDVCYPVTIESNPTVDPLLQEVINNIKYILRDYWKCFKTEELFEYPRFGNMAINSLEEHVTCLEYRKVVESTGVYETVDCYPVQSNGTIERFNAMIQELRKVYSKSRTCNNIVGYVYDESLLNHKPTGDTGKCPPERPERLTEIIKRFEEFGLKDRCKHIELIKFDERAWLEKVHGSEYISNILNQKNITEKVDWYFNDQTSHAIRKCVSSVLSLAQNISDGSIRAGVAVIRPPGHHALCNGGSGFCFVNNVVVAAQYLTEKLHYKRVLIVDFDIHHGNGTQELTYERSDILYLSIHRFDQNKFFPACEEANYTYTGKNCGEGYNINIPFNKDKKKNIDYWTVWYKLVLPIAYSYNPDFVIISAGFDAGIFDPLGGGYQVTPEMYGQLVQTLKPLASGRVLLALEGGYHLETTALSMVACVKALLGDPLPVPTFSEEVSEDTLETVRNVVRQQRSKWPLLEVNKRIANFLCMRAQLTKLEELSQINPADEGTLQQFRDLVIQCRNNGSGFYDA